MNLSSRASFITGNIVSIAGPYSKPESANSYAPSVDFITRAVSLDFRR